MKKLFKISFNIIAIVMLGMLFISFLDPVTGMSMAFAMPTFADLNFEDGQDNMAGTRLLAYYIPVEDIETIPGYVASPADLGDYATIDTAFVCKTGKNFLALYASPDSGKIDDNKIEGKDTNAYESIYEFFFPKNDAASLGFQRIAPTTKFVVIVIEADGNKRVLGIKEGLPATISSVAGSTGTNSSGEKGATFQIKSIQNGPAPIYTAEIPLIAAS